eukprot:TRINITY_DN10144_c0_g3_i1.p1 TRINITY_DN10144_c0_g3~~TRINITY_DN10144_c0_g3_i1.p1  ORF type:complete len:464 (+),score=78.73 TRINITY_DN10144_c0_g3_i1:123-1514(+)
MADGTCDGCALPLTPARPSFATASHEGYKACLDCIKFMIRATSPDLANPTKHLELQAHGTEPECTLKQGRLSIQSCTGCLYQRCRDISVVELVNFFKMSYAALPSHVQSLFPELSASPVPAFTVPLPLSTAGPASEATPPVPSVHSPSQALLAREPAAKLAKLEYAALSTAPIRPALVLNQQQQQQQQSEQNVTVKQEYSSAQSAAEVLASMPRAMPEPIDAHAYQPPARAASRRNRKAKPKGLKGFCLGCWKTKELEERYALNSKSKFALCNACRKTHLTKTIIPVFEQIARQPPAAVDKTVQLRIRDQMEANWTATQKDGTSARLLDMWLNLDTRRAILNGVCTYLQPDEVRNTAIKVVKDHPGLADLFKQTSTDSDQNMWEPRYVRVAGHLFSMSLPCCPTAQLHELRKAVSEGLKLLVEDAVQHAMTTNADLLATMSRCELGPENITVKTEDVILLFQA